MKQKIFIVTSSPKDHSGVLLVNPETIKNTYCAVVNVSDSPYATFDYQKTGIPSFWFPIHEINQWGYPPFFGTLKVVNEYYKGDKPVLIHCRAGANRSPSVAYAILLAKGYTEEEAAKSINYGEIIEVFNRNVERNQIPKNIVEFLKTADNDDTKSLHYVLAEMDTLYDTWSQQKFSEQEDYVLKNEDKNSARLVYNKEKRRFVIIKN